MAPVPDSFKAVLKLVLSVRKPNDTIAVFEGCFRQVRHYLCAEGVESDGRDFLGELWMAYETADKSDFRNANHKLKFSNTDRET